MNATQCYPESEAQLTLAACKQRLMARYGPKMDALILYGSAARQKLKPDSDIDLLVLLSPPFDYFKELYVIIDLLYPLQLESSHWISAKPANLNEFGAQQTQLYRNVQQEGIVL